MKTDDKYVGSIIRVKISAGFVFGLCTHSCRSDVIPYMGDFVLLFRGVFDEYFDNIDSLVSRPVFFGTFVFLRSLEKGDDVTILKKVVIPEKYAKEPTLRMGGAVHIRNGNREVEEFFAVRGISDIEIPLEPMAPTKLRKLSQRSISDIKVIETRYRYNLTPERMYDIATGSIELDTESEALF